MNEDHPLVEAMRRPRTMMQQRDMISVDLPDALEGDAVELSVLGVVKSIQNGKALVEVQKVEEEEEDQPEQVMTQESHMPG